jgi:hypothetical protein
MTEPIKLFRFECAEGCRPSKWGTYREALRQMKLHGPGRKRGQGHGGSVIRRWPGGYCTRRINQTTWIDAGPGARAVLREKSQ